MRDLLHVQSDRELTGWVDYVNQSFYLHFGFKFCTYKTIK